jgi:HEAT repeat protein
MSPKSRFRTAAICSLAMQLHAQAPSAQSAPQASSPVRALFVLGQIDTPPARALLLKNALESSWQLQFDAIRAVGISGDAPSLKALLPIFLAGNSVPQERAMSTLTIADDRTLMAQRGALKGILP